MELHIMAKGGATKNITKGRSDMNLSVVVGINNMTCCMTKGKKSFINLAEE